MYSLDEHSRRNLPRRLHTLFKLILAGADPRRIVLFRDADAGVTEQDGDLIDGDSGQQHFDGEGVAEHVAMGTLGCAVRLVQVGYSKKSPVGSLPVGHVSLGQAVARPEEVIRVGVQSGRNRAQQFGHVGWQGHKDRRTRLCLIKQEFVVLEAGAFKWTAWQV